VDLIFTWSINKRARGARVVFESTQPAVLLRIRSFEIYSRQSGRR
jgi:hypothetical protein